MSTYYNICAEHTKTIDGKERTHFQKVGYIKATSNGGWYITLYHQPKTEFRVFGSTEDDLPVIN